MNDGNAQALFGHSIGDGFNFCIELFIDGFGLLFFAVDPAHDVQIVFDVVISLGAQQDNRNAAVFELGRQFFMVVRTADDDVGLKGRHFFQADAVDRAHVGHVFILFRKGCVFRLDGGPSNETAVEGIGKV